MHIIPCMQKFMFRDHPETIIDMHNFLVEHYIYCQFEIILLEEYNVCKYTEFKETPNEVNQIIH